MLSVLLKCSSHAVISHRNHEKGMESLPEQRFWGCFWSKQSTVAVLFPLALLWQRTEIGQGRVSTVTQLMVLQGKESKTGGCQRLLFTAAWHMTWEAMTLDARANDRCREGRSHPSTLFQNSTFLEKPLTAFTTSHCPGPERPYLSRRFRDL